MDGIKNKERFAEIERVLGDYFDLHLAPVIRDTENHLRSKQKEEMARFSKSAAGILNDTMSNPYQNLKLTGEWNSKTAEDFIGMCKEKIANDKDLQKDLAIMAGEWRSAVVKEIGRNRYDELSSKLGGDLAYAFVEYRIEQMMIDKIVKDRMPRSSADYIIRKAAQNTMFGLSSILTRSPLAAEIEKRGEAAYKPTKLEKGTGWAIGAGIDAISFGGGGSWGSFARFVGVDLAINAVTSSDKQDNSPSVESCISKGVFGSDNNVFDDFRKDAVQIRKDKNEYIIATNERLTKKIGIPTFDFSDLMAEKSPNIMFFNYTSKEQEQEQKERYKNVPMMIAPGQEEAYLQEMEQTNAGNGNQQLGGQNLSEREADAVGTVSQTESTDNSDLSEEETALQANDESGQSSQTNENGWEGLLSSIGLGDIGAVGKNLGYVLSMLPEILIGMFTGKTKSLNIGDNLLPIASIVAGIFIKNPILKMMMIGLGGANLLNKAGHEVLSDKKESDTVHYRVYQDEALNPRIANPILQGNNLVAIIDKVPCTIQLPEKVVAAYNAGALPLNTLANAILAKSDQTQQIMAMNYDNSDKETIVRTRGIQ